LTNLPAVAHILRKNGGVLYWGCPMIIGHDGPREDFATTEIILIKK
jgi:hypothetical protein